MDAIKLAWDTGCFPHFFEVLGFGDLAVLTGAWDWSRNEFDDELRVLCEMLELRKQEYTKECRELGGRSAGVEQILLRIWGVDDSHLEGRIPEIRAGGQRAKCDDLAIEEEEKEEMERAIEAITATIRDSPLANDRVGGSASERDQYTAFAPLASTYWVEHTSTGFRHAILKMESFNHVAPISVKALQFLGNMIDAQVKECRAQGSSGSLNAPGQMITLPTGRRSWEKQKSECDEFLHLRYTSRVMEPLSIRRLLNEILARSRRYADMRSDSSIRLLQNEGCTHVITLDTSITGNPLLQGIINSGLNHIPCMALDVDEAESEVDDFLDRLFTTVMELRDLTTSTRSFLRRIVLKKAKGRITKYREEHRHVTAEPFEHSAVKRELEFLTGRFLICLTDKAPNTPAFVCKNFIRKMAFQRLSGPEFVSIAPPPAAVIARIQGELSAIPALPIASAALPYLMTVFKAHKGTFRWITNTTNTVVSPAADLCACLLRFLLPLAQTFCQERSLEVEEQYGVRPNLWWAIALVGEFSANLLEKVFSVFSTDITRCFETIPTDNSEDSLPAAVRFYVQSAMRCGGRGARAMSFGSEYGRMAACGHPRWTAIRQRVWHLWSSGKRIFVGSQSGASPTVYCAWGTTYGGR
ncbi:hypothetical protein CBR_g31352 [Chara braunii]|uniref:Uncharacterized protein n=1 Tax=Chara braunii TaxID=69332 RepID=A0A388LER1_CHABU|nr:hypothetical protein CBR_g31352 [Chara braunii]|eukprot:GBG80796.1 hypothetical protein CBR_g31352 [Chara braunii]